MTLRPIALTPAFPHPSPELPLSVANAAPSPSPRPVLNPVLSHDELDNAPRFGGGSRLALALMAMTLLGGCASSRNNVPHTPEARLDARNANAQPRGARLGTYLENTYGMSIEKANALLALPYAEYPRYFPSRFDVYNKGSAVSDSQSVLPELARKEITAQDLRDVRALLVDPASVMPELPLKYPLETQRHQLLSTIRSRAMNSGFRPTSFSNKPHTYAEIIKIDTYMTQMRDEAEMRNEYKAMGLSDRQVASLAAIGDAMSQRDRLPEIPNLTFEGPVNFPKGLNRHWQFLGIDHPTALAKLSDAHWEAMRDTVVNAQPKPHARLNRTDAFMAADREFMRWLRTESEFGNLKYWANKPPADFAAFLADKAGYEPASGRPPARLLPPQPDEALPPPADELPPPAVPRQNPNPAPSVPIRPDRIAGTTLPGVVVGSSPNR